MLYFGDNVKILREYVSDARVDLIYLDPPFNSSATYNFSVAPLYERRDRESLKTPVADRRYSGWGLESEAVYKEIVTSGPRIRRVEHEPPVN